MNTPDKEAARAADDAALSAAEAVLHSSWHFGEVYDAAKSAVDIARRLQGENRELRETLERVRETTRHGTGGLEPRKFLKGIREVEYDNTSRIPPPDLVRPMRRPTRIAAIADAEKGTP